MTFELTILGSGSALPTSRRYPTAQALNVLERFFLIDCGEGTQLQVRKARVKLGKLNTIFISHLHGDHVFGLFGLLSSFNLLGRRNDLTLYGPPGLDNVLGFFRSQFAEELQYKIYFKPLESRTFHQIYEDNVSEVFAFPLKHRIPCWGYLFKEKQKEPNIIKEAIQKYNLGIKDIVKIKSGAEIFTSDGEIVSRGELIIEAKEPRSYAYCSDTAYYERITKWVEGVDLLYHEATFCDADRKIAKQTGHSTASQAALIAKNAGAKKLLLGHFSNRYADLTLLLNEARTIFPNSFLSEDLEVYKVD
jgi:ribonuclease Z